MTIPEVQIPLRPLTTQGPVKEIAEFISELSRRVELDEILAKNHIASMASEKSIRRWLSDCIIPEIDDLIDVNITILPVDREVNSDCYGDIFSDDGWILLFSLGSVNYFTFDISKQICAYEKKRPGLGRYVLGLCGMLPYEFGTPNTMKNFVRFSFWGDMEDEMEFATELLGENDPEEIESILEYIPVKLDDLNQNFPAWSFDPQYKIRGKVPPEIAELAKIAKAKTYFKNMVIPYSNLPGIFLWEDVNDLWEKALCRVEEECMNSGDDIKIGGAYWPIPLKDSTKFHEVLDEIEGYIRQFYLALQAIYRIKQKDFLV